MVPVAGDFPQPYGACEHFRQSHFEETQNPLQGAVDILHGFVLIAQCYSQIFANSTRADDAGINNFLPLQLANKFAADIRFAFTFVEKSEIFTVFGLAIIWTLVRYFLVNCVFRPGARWAGVQEKNVEKLCESAWKALADFVTWLAAFRVVFFCGYDFFEKPLQMFSDWSMTRPPPGDLAFVYALEFSFYLHCSYATFYMDAWRKDSIVMMTHHCVTMALISFSYVVRCLKIGVLIFCLNDISDALLEGGKVATYLRHRKTGFSRFFSLVSDFAAGIFALSWVVNRLYFHLTKVWRGSAIGLWVSHPLLPMPFHLFLNVFLGVLYMFYLYWFYFIAIFVLRVVFGKGGSAEDPREDEASSTKLVQNKKKNFVDENSDEIMNLMLDHHPLYKKKIIEKAPIKLD